MKNTIKSNRNKLLFVIITLLSACAIESQERYKADQSFKKDWEYDNKSFLIAVPPPPLAQINN